MAVHSSILAWKIPWTEELGGLWPMGRNCYAQVAKSPSDHQGADTNAKAREFLLPSSSWGSHRYRGSDYREEP